MANLRGDATEEDVPGVLGTSVKYNGVLGVSEADGHAGVAGVNETGTGNGVYGRSKFGQGVIGYSAAIGKAGVAGVNDEGEGAGVYGTSAKGAGVHGESRGFNGVLGVTTADGHSGVAGVSDVGQGNGVYGRSKNVDGVVGYSSAPDHSGVAGVNDNGGFGVYGKSSGLAGMFEGDVMVTGDIRLANADCAEDFDICEGEDLAAGMVVVLGDDGALHPSEVAYDRRVAGVISGAGAYRPGLVLDRRETGHERRPVALLGKVYCMVDASFGPIAIGDLLTSSPTRGHAMKAGDQARAFGAVIGKALRPLEEGQALLPILIALQ